MAIARVVNFVNKSHGYVTELGRRVEAATRATMNALRSEFITSTADFSIAFCDELDRSLAGTVAGSTVITRSVDNDAVAPADPPGGAQLAVVFYPQFSDFRSRTGIFLAMSCRQSDESPNVANLQQRCRRMLRTTSAAYVLLATPDRMTVLPATAVLGASDLPTEARERFYYKSPAPFFLEFFTGFLGDRALAQPGTSLNETLTEHEISTGLSISMGPEQTGLSDFME